MQESIWLVLDNMNKNRVYKKSTHCKECGVMFDDVNKRAGSNVKCIPCYKQYTRDVKGSQSREFYAAYRPQLRESEYEIMRTELESIEERETWLELIKIRLENILNKLAK